MASSTWKTLVFSLRRFLRWFAPYDYVRTAVGLVLLFGAGAKLYQLVFAPSSLAIQGGILASKWAVVTLVEVELFLAVCMLFNLWRRATWIATLLLFGVFSVYSATKAWAGEACGCFGAVSAEIPAWVSLSLDLTAIAVLSVIRPVLRIGHQAISEMACESNRGASGDRFRKRLRPIATGFSLVLIPVLGTGVALHEPRTTVKQPGFHVIDGRTVVVDPNVWIGKRFPLLEYIDIGDELSVGEWTVLLYHHECPLCIAVLDELRVLEGGHNVGRRPLAVIEIPPCGPWVPLASHIVSGALSDKLTWLVPTPLYVHLIDGHVRDMERVTSAKRIVSDFGQVGQQVVVHSGSEVVSRTEAEVSGLISVTMMKFSSGRR